MTKINLYTGEINFDTPMEAAEFWFAYMKKLVPGLEEQCKKAGETYADNIFKNQFGKPGKA